MSGLSCFFRDFLPESSASENREPKYASSLSSLLVHDKSQESAVSNNNDDDEGYHAVDYYVAGCYRVDGSSRSWSDWCRKRNEILTEFMNHRFLVQPCPSGGGGGTSCPRRPRQLIKADSSATDRSKRRRLKQDGSFVAEAGSGNLGDVAPQKHLGDVAPQQQQQQEQERRRHTHRSRALCSQSPLPSPRSRCRSLEDLRGATTPHHILATKDCIKTLTGLSLFTRRMTLRLCLADKIWPLRETASSRRHVAATRTTTTKSTSWWTVYTAAPQLPRLVLSLDYGCGGSRTAVSASSAPPPFLDDGGPLCTCYNRVLSCEVRVMSLEPRDEEPEEEEEDEVPCSSRIRVFFYDDYADALNAVLAERGCGSRFRGGIEEGEKDDGRVENTVQGDKGLCSGIDDLDDDQQPRRLLLSLDKIPSASIFPWAPTDWCDRQQDLSDCCVCIGGDSLAFKQNSIGGESRAFERNSGSAYSFDSDMRVYVGLAQTEEPRCDVHVGRHDDVSTALPEWELEPHDGIVRACPCDLDDGPISLAYRKWLRRHGSKDSAAALPRRVPENQRGSDGVTSGAAFSDDCAVTATEPSPPILDDEDEASPSQPLIQPPKDMNSNKLKSPQEEKNKDLSPPPPRCPGNQCRPHDAASSVPNPESGTSSKAFPDDVPVTANARPPPIVDERASPSQQRVPPRDSEKSKKLSSPQEKMKDLPPPPPPHECPENQCQPNFDYAVPEPFEVTSGEPFPYNRDVTSNDVPVPLVIPEQDASPSRLPLLNDSNAKNASSRQDGSFTSETRSLSFPSALEPPPLSQKVFPSASVSTRTERTTAFRHPWEEIRARQSAPGDVRMPARGRGDDHDATAGGGGGFCCCFGERSDGEPREMRCLPHSHRSKESS